MFQCLFDDVRKVAATAVLHEYIENASIAVYEAVVVSHYVVVVQVFQDVTSHAFSGVSGTIDRQRTLLPQFASCHARSFVQSQAPSVQRSVEYT